MAKLASPDDLVSYAKRKLGSPVVNIEIDETQEDDRIEDAIQLFTQRHYNGSEEVYISHTVTSSEATKGYFEAPEGVEAILELYELNGSSDSSIEAFDRLSYRLANSDIFDFLTTGGGGMVDYYLTQMHINLINELFVPRRSFNFNAVTHRFVPAEPFRTGEVFAYRAFKIIDPSDFEDVYDNEWVKKYATALIKKQWGTNLKKFDGVQMPGGVTLNGQTTYDEAEAEITKLEEEFSLTYELPLDMIIA